MTFNGPAFIQHIAKRLVQEFEFSAGAGTPGLVGAAKEHPARVQLERLMPYGIGVGSGLIVDSYGGMSKQQDIVIYEMLCPVFTHNGSAEASYYPVEGVVAAGEVKSSLGKQQLEDGFAKSKSVKVLRRHAVATDDGLGLKTVSFRNYAVQNCFAGTKEEEFDQDLKSLDQVYTFILCEKFGPSPASVLKNAAELSRATGIALSPNFIASLKDGFVVPYAATKNSITRAAFEADSLMFCDQPEQSFAQLLNLLRVYARSGHTVDRVHYERYFKPYGGDVGLRIAERVSL